MQCVKCADLILDFDFYPRHSLDSQHIAEIVEARKAGVEMPPCVACKKTKRVTDGFHRIRSEMRIGGAEAEINCIFKTYKNDKDMFLDACRLNAHHGRALAAFDRVHCLIRGESLGITKDTLCGVLAMTRERGDKLTSTRTASFGKQTVPIKLTIKHKAGKVLTPKQMIANDKLSGMHQLFYVNQLIVLFQNDLIDSSNDELIARLTMLGEFLAKIG